MPSIACKPALAGGIAPLPSCPTRRHSEPRLVRQRIPPGAEAHSTSVAVSARLKSGPDTALAAAEGGGGTLPHFQRMDCIQSIRFRRRAQLIRFLQNRQFRLPRRSPAALHLPLQVAENSRIAMPSFALAKGILQIPALGFGSGNRGLHFLGLAGGSWGTEHDEAHFFKKACQSRGGQMGDCRVKIRF